MPGVQATLQNIEDIEGILGDIRDDLRDEAQQSLLDQIHNGLVNDAPDSISLHNDLGAMAECCAETNTTLSAISTILNIGFQNLSLGMAALIELQNYTNQVLDHQSDQNDAIICLLDRIYEAVCGIHNEAHTQTGLQTSIEESSGTLTELYKTTHSEAALELERLGKLEEHLLECCPPEEPEPVCEYRECDAPEPMEEEPPEPHFDPLQPEG